MQRIGFYAEQAIAASETWPTPTRVQQKGGVALKGAKGIYHLTVEVMREQARGDLDNFVKAVKDALTKSGVWWDDGMVRRCVSEMGDARHGDPFTRITVERMSYAN